MSARLEKLKRRAARAELGISKRAEREEAEFAAQVARLNHEIAQRHELPIVRRDGHRQRLAWFVLFLFFWAIGTCIAAALGAR